LKIVGGSSSKEPNEIIKDLLLSARAASSRGVGGDYVICLTSGRGRQGAREDGRVLGMAWFLAVMAWSDIAENGHSTGLAAIGRLGRGWAVAAGEADTGTAHF
jgi:hypothetical protein